MKNKQSINRYHNNANKKADGVKKIIKRVVT